MNGTASKVGSEHAGEPQCFPLLWTIGISGHRRLPDEAAVRFAVRQELAELKRAAAAMNARLTGVSSLALGTDLLFAEECLAAGLPWKCLLPFPLDEFRKDDFSNADWQRVEKCLASAYHIEESTSGVPVDQNARNLAYRTCGQQTVEQADVMLLVWNEEGASGVGGTAEMWDYARTLNKPIWHYHSVNGQVQRAGWPGDPGEWKNRTLFKSRVSPLILEASNLAPSHTHERAQNPHPEKSATQIGLEVLFEQLDRLALKKQGDAQGLMRRVLIAHLLATSAAALSVTLVANGCWHSIHGVPLMVTVAVATYSLLVLGKPLLASLAMRWERQLHHLQTQEHWVEARVAAELCRSALHCWRFPHGPLNVFDPEDFPHFKRLIRSLRTAREAENPSASLPEDEAVALYLERRIGQQMDYFAGKHQAAIKENDHWQRKFNLATWFVIIAGGILGVVETSMAWGTAFMPHDSAHAGVAAQLLHMVESAGACLLIVAPFYASYALAMLAIRDCRRRRDRYAAMKQFLERQKLRLSRVKSTASRVAVVENTERMLLEELHEWYSVMRAVRI